MSRYVDAEYVKAVMLNDRLMQGNAEFTLYVQQVETQVNALPGIDIVRCSECKHWRRMRHGRSANCGQMTLMNQQRLKPMTSAHTESVRKNRTTWKGVANE